MANIVKHRFASAKANGPDATQVQPSHWNDGHAFTGGVDGNVLIRDSTDVNFGASWVPVGEWTNVPFSALNFAGSAGMVWTVSAANQTTYAYTRLGRTVFVLLTVGGSSISGTPGAPLVITLPAGFVNARNSDTVGWGNNAGVIILVRFRFVASDPRVYLYPMTGSANWEASAANTGFSGQFVFSI